MGPSDVKVAWRTLGPNYIETALCIIDEKYLTLRRDSQDNYYFVNTFQLLLLVLLFALLVEQQGANCVTFISGSTYTHAHGECVNCVKHVHLLMKTWLVKLGIKRYDRHEALIG